MPDDVTAGVMERVIAGLLADAHLMAPEHVPGLLAAHARPLGVHTVVLYLADLQQRYLRPLPADGVRRFGVEIDGTLAGRCFQTITLLHAPTGGGLHRLWIPLMDGTERLGVVELVTSDVTERALARYRMLASLAGLLVVSKSAYSDTYAQVRRDEEMALQAEMAWAFMAPPTFSTEQVMISAVLEPAYQVGGDAFDYTLLGDRMHVSVFDATGHDLAAGLISSVAMAACRNARRAGAALADLSAHIDRAICEQFGDARFATALICDLSVPRGELSWVVCGHPPPLLIRDRKVVKELARPPVLPLGIGDGTVPRVYTEQLEPRDRVLFYTDGVVEGRDDTGRPFGVERLGDFVIRHGAAGVPAPETLRRLNREIIGYQSGRLADDATTVLLEWMPDRPREQLTFRLARTAAPAGHRRVLDTPRGYGYGSIGIFGKPGFLRSDGYPPAV